MSFNILHTYLIDRKYDLIPRLLVKSDSCQRTASVKLYGEYPLHIAIKQEAPDDVVLSLVDAFPAALFHSNRKGENVVEMASRLHYSERVIDEMNGRRRIFQRQSSTDALSDSLDTISLGRNRSRLSSAEGHVITNVGKMKLGSSERTIGRDSSRSFWKSYNRRTIG